MYITARNYQQLFSDSGFAIPLTNYVKNRLSWIEKQGWTERGICYAASRSFDKLYEMRRDSRFWSVFYNEVKKWAFKKDDPRWESFNKERTEKAAKALKKLQSVHREKPENNKTTPVKQKKRRKEKKEKPKPKPKPEKRFTLRNANTRESCVYFIQSENGGPIKIGISTNVQGRLASLQTGYPYPLKVLATIPGGEREEKGLHETFAEHRLSGEWFEPVDKLIDLITKIENGK